MGEASACSDDLFTDEPPRDAQKGFSKEDMLEPTVDAEGRVLRGQNQWLSRVPTLYDLLPTK